MKYRNIVFLQNQDDYREFEKVLFPDSDEFSTGWPDEHAAMDYLMQWDYDEPSEEYDTIGAGSSDTIYRRDGYVMTYNSGLSYAGLEKEVPDNG